MDDQLRDGEEFLHLDVTNHSLQQINPAFERDELSAENAKKLYDSLEYFHDLTGSMEPTHLYSKLRFVQELVKRAYCSEELLLHVLADRSFYFSEHRDMGNLLGDNKRILPAYSTRALLETDDVKLDAEISPEDLIKRGLDGCEDAGIADDHLIEVAKACFRKYLNPAPRFVIPVKQMRGLLVQKCGDKKPSKEDVDAVLYPYKAALENNRRAKLVYKHGWIPTTAHLYVWRELQTNLRHLKEIKQRRQDDLLYGNKIIDNLNQLALKCANAPKEERSLQSMDETSRQAVRLFEIYVRSQLHAVRTKSYLSILTTPDQPIEKRLYAHAIFRLLYACKTESGWHPLTPLFLYHAFAGNTETVLLNKKAKLVRKISRIEKAARIKNMTCMTGRRAAVNLVLYRKLCSLFPVNSSWCILNRKDADDCEKKVHIDASIRCRIELEHCFSEKNSKASCPFARTALEVNDWGFSLTTGYGNLYHHRQNSDDSIVLTYDELYMDRSDTTQNEKKAPFVLQMNVGNQYSVFRYLIDFTNPVGKWEGALQEHVRNCLPNRPRFLTPLSPTAYYRNNDDPFYAPYEELSTLLLQDMHLPAMRRLIRTIKKLLSEHHEYLNQYHDLLIASAPSSRIIELLDQIIKQHGLERQITLYTAYQISGKSFNVRNSLYSVLEFELRAQIYDDVQMDLLALAKRVFDAKLMLYSSEQNEEK